MLLRHILPERIFAVQHTRHPGLNQQTQCANPLLTRKNEVSEIAFSQQRQIIIKLQLVAENLQIVRAKQRQTALSHL
ncbi:hypothetical protein D3C87_1899780 [compost metagenome]